MKTIIFKSESVNKYENPAKLIT